MAYFPNGTAGMDFQQQYCDRCANADDDGMCSIWDVHMIYNYEQHEDDRIAGILELLIPDHGACTMFKKSDAA